MRVLDKTMVEYVKYLRTVEDIDNIRRFWKCESYAKFLSQEIKLGMFVPCKDGAPLSESINPKSIEPQPNFGQEDYDELVRVYNEYQEAKEKVLFEGFELTEKNSEVAWVLKFDEFLMEIKFYLEDDSYFYHGKQINKIEDLIPYRLRLIKEI
ncbi:hypothetical protein Phi17218_111 [Cellulophaga phage phi17:2_18]|uniref:Uncharacterized protein n=2 Tax=Lightbulbvirus Cba172 TaxID=1918525 RepID=R9ZWQ0_9CAUD|nr:hypothetical protein Phi17:2_gp111 [Cellulophaga phage phi17:2]AGO47644.1 hypothetical protein Phi17:2_gp111 [Cellulophaga phage phi17:2]ALO80514.1 hypothetical protein Phi17218_111 [Cellulophaga phage phi17:2_18]